MEIEDIDGMPTSLAEEEYLQRPQKPSSLEKPVKKKRVMSEKQLANLARAREISAQKRAEKKGKSLKKIEEVVEPDELSGTIDEEEESDGEYVAPLPPQKKQKKRRETLIDYDYIMDSVYNRMNSEREEEEYMRQEQNAYDENIRKQERNRLMKLVEQKQKKPVQKDAWDACFAPQNNRGNGDIFF